MSFFSMVLASGSSLWGKGHPYSMSHAPTWVTEMSTSPCVVRLTVSNLRLFFLNRIRMKVVPNTQWHDIVIQATLSSKQTSPSKGHSSHSKGKAFLESGLRCSRPITSCARPCSQSTVRHALICEEISSWVKTSCQGSNSHNSTSGEKI